MKIFNFDLSVLNFALKGKKRTAASVAKERLQIIVSHESTRKGPDIMKQLQLELIEVISRYIKVDQDQIKVQLERSGDHSVLELNVTLPDGGTLISTSASAAS